MNPWIWHQICLEFSQVHIEGSIKAKGSSDGRHNLSYKAVEVSIRGPLNVKVPAADIIDGLMVNHEGTVGVLQRGVGGQDGVVGLHDSSGNLRSRVNRELQLGLLAIVNRKAFHEKGSQSGSCATSKRMEDEESLKSSTLVSKLSDAVQD